jgi:hypothetical protein
MSSELQPKSFFIITDTLIHSYIITLKKFFKILQQYNSNITDSHIAVITNIFSVSLINFQQEINDYVKQEEILSSTDTKYYTDMLTNMFTQVSVFFDNYKKETQEIKVNQITQKIQEYTVLYKN